MIDIGDKAPDFNLPASGETAQLSLADAKGPLVLFFYPRDDTPGCTKEAIAFTGMEADFAALGVTIWGISADSVASHEKFAAKHALSMPLLSDEDNAVCEAFGVWKEKNMYGKKFFGIERATFLINADGTIAQAWRKVKVPGHAEAVLEAAKALSA
ncbi:peroxiredoxin Q/BCP [Planktotalea frisia]|jgi:peroxiredoxin Q/BCP|uniref:thioredoxin-dependent peroxiredoxin n=1 Tax=Planktotalea frisia TaxID=696762 RepID=A0A1L9NYR3_9RHOB|nr:peroxiredoxin [Planktotalea frisia]OJI94416.1 putative peroxiredoxin bcp [Planktotalea frisia]PZX30078.1 peroxiredoxin Q/BCP [Planktotalea frisia]